MFLPIKGASIQPTNRLYGYKAYGDTWFMIMHQVSHNDEHFTIELMTNTAAELPLSGASRNPKVDPYRVPIRFRAARLWSSSAKDPWWEVEPAMTRQEIERRLRDHDYCSTPVDEFLPRLEPLVDDAVDKLIESAVPYFQKVMEANSPFPDSVGPATT
jgi:hypothetical protein